MVHPKIIPLGSEDTEIMEEGREGEYDEGGEYETTWTGGSEDNSLAQRSMRRLLAMPRREGLATTLSNASLSSTPHLVLPPSLDRRPSAGKSTQSRAETSVHQVTTDTNDVLRGLKETALDAVFPSAPEKIYNLMFTSGFMKEFWIKNQKLMGPLLLSLSLLFFFFFARFDR